VVIRIPRSLFLKMLEGYPEAARTLRDAMAERVAQWSDDLKAVKAKLEAGSVDKD
jgi:CRP-like cAMP-binding protein